MKKTILLLLVGVLLPLSAAMAQGSVRGKVIDKETGEYVWYSKIKKYILL